jgi:CTP synthase
MRLGAQDMLVVPGTIASMLFGGKTSVRERFRHRYEVDPQFVQRLEAAGMVFSGRHPTRPIMQMMELRPPGSSPENDGGPATTHPFFIGGQFHPELTSRPLRPQPMFMGLVAAAIQKKYGSTIDPRDPWATELNRWMITAKHQPANA